jgi:hypothetical protein
VMPTLWEAVAKARQEELRREAEQQHLARLARSRTRGDRTRPGRFAATAIGRAVAGAARVLQPRPRGPEEGTTEGG